MNSYEYNGHVYRFRRDTGTVLIFRDDGCSPFSTFSSFDDAGKPCYRAYTPALRSIREAQMLIRGEIAGLSTYTNRVVWARSEYQAMRIRERQDKEGHTA